MGLSLFIGIEYEVPPDVSKRKWSDISKKGMAAIANMWEDRFVGQHFKVGAGKKYNYQNRSPRTWRRKRRGAQRGEVRKSGRAYLVHSGLLEQQMQRSGFLRVFPTRLTLRKPAPSYVTNRPRGGRPNMHDEITEQVPSETEALAETYKKVTLAEHEKLKAKKTVRI